MLPTLPSHAGYGAFSADRHGRAEQHEGHAMEKAVDAGPYPVEYLEQTVRSPDQLRPLLHRRALPRRGDRIEAEATDGGVDHVDRDAHDEDHGR